MPESHSCEQTPREPESEKHVHQGVHCNRHTIRETGNERTARAQANGHRRCGVCLSLLHAFSTYVVLVFYDPHFSGGSAGREPAWNVGDLV